MAIPQNRAGLTIAPGQQEHLLVVGSRGWVKEPVEKWRVKPAYGRKHLNLQVLRYAKCSFQGAA